MWYVLWRCYLCTEILRIRCFPLPSSPSYASTTVQSMVLGLVQVGMVELTRQHYSFFIAGLPFKQAYLQWQPSRMSQPLKSQTSWCLGTLIFIITMNSWIGFELIISNLLFFQKEKPKLIPKSFQEIYKICQMLVYNWGLINGVSKSFFWSFP